MRAQVTCDQCGHQQKVERRFHEAEFFHIVCHDCECILEVDVQDEDILKAFALARVA